MLREAGRGWHVYQARTEDPPSLSFPRKKKIREHTLLLPDLSYFARVEGTPALLCDSDTDIHPHVYHIAFSLEKNEKR